MQKELQLPRGSYEGFHYPPPSHRTPSNKRYFIFTKPVIQTFDRGNIGGDLTSGKGNRIETQLYYQ